MDELIEKLRFRHKFDDMCMTDECRKCKYRYRESCNIWTLMDDAADAIERLTDEVDRKDKALQAWVNTWESRKENAIRHICDHCDTPIDVRLKEGACEDCPIITLVKEIFDEQQS